MKITQINLFPIKSTQPYGVEQAFVLPQGLNFDREFMLTESDGTFITARKEKALYEIQAFPIPAGIVVCYQNTQCLVRYQDFTQTQSSEVWGTHFPSKVADERVNHWFSQILGRTVQLRWLGEKSQRTVENFSNPMSFGDSNPILLTSQKSLEQLQQWSPVPVEMGQFRANLVIDGKTAFEEEQWRRIKIGDVELEFAQCCTRCMLITRDLHSKELDANAEPFRTLKQQHTNEKGKPIFGIHLVPKNSGVIRVNDPIFILE